ncbi:hypothetical protein WR25_14339 [Diploscapter pachys]|uniref:1-acyl-sn-glycerol-3-phosphate acyltransferase n=1 Tax=Diploscapter pachys TaxID=2018661 RepID=A0A2A2KH61_9BILA|nr:hypothetical protein WR25_14339 [Diploscapter pachys]
MTEDVESDCCCRGFWFWAAIIFAFLTVLWNIRGPGYYVKGIYYSLALTLGGLIGGLLAVPRGRSTNNHYLIFRIFRYFCLPLRLNIEYKHADILARDEPCIIIANHQSALDVWAMTHVWPENCIVMLKSSLKWLPGFNLCAYVCESIFINRFSKEKSHKTVDQTLEIIVKKKRKVFMYPEGTRNAKPELLPFKKGAFILAKQAKISLIPIAFSSHKFFYEHEKTRFDSNGHILAEVMEPVPYDKFDSIDDLAAYCRTLIQAKREELDRELMETWYKGQKLE